MNLSNLTTYAQNSPTFTTKPNLTKAQFDSLYQSIMYQDYLNYQKWQQNLPKLQRKVRTNHTIRGLSWGIFAGMIAALPFQAVCEVIPGNSCNSIIVGASLGGLIGLLAGQSKGRRKAKELKHHVTYQ